MAAVVLPSCRPHQVIDVDLLDDLPLPPQRRRRISAAPIDSWRPVPSSTASSCSQDVIVIDSDDEGEDGQEVAPFGSSRSRPRLRSPPAPIPRTSIPPLPPLPRATHARWASTPSTSTAPQRSGVIHPNPQPFAFESSLSSRAVTPSTSTFASASHTPAAGPSNISGPSAAPRSHHVPTMGFGGALLALNRQNVLERNIELERRAQRQRERQDELMRRIIGDSAPSIGGNRANGSGVTPQWPWHFGGAGSSSRVGAGAMIDFDREVAMDLQREMDNEIGGSWRAGVLGLGSDILHRLAFGRRRSVVTQGFRMDEEPFAAHMARARPPFREAYTHPQPVAPGFTHNFVPGDTIDSTPKIKSTEVIVLNDDGDIIPADPQEGSSSSVTVSGSDAASDEGTLLVCAHCLDPLVLGAIGPRRLWALRCGHMLDGKCADALMRPPLQKEDERAKEILVNDRKGKGKAEVADAQSEAENAERSTSTRRKDKGKGKAVDTAPLPSPPLSMASTSLPAPDASQLAEPTHPAVDSIPVLSRLRPRNHGGQVVHPPRHPPGSPSLKHNTHPSSSSGYPRASTLANIPNPVVDPSAQPPNPQDRARTGKRSHTTKARSKGKGKALVPRVLETRTWLCPVAGCGREHISERIENLEGEEVRWVHKEGEGAIAGFA
ncbi:hypothetical protein OF83DRAFT_378065 [Amylostereum chailletii]|nr:hypothetical protein OF83DRAFT_378065 [Amylostereum chailletii]